MAGQMKRLVHGIKRALLFAVMLCVCAGSVYGGWEARGVAGIARGEKPDQTPSERREPGYRFISPLLECEGRESPENPALGDRLGKFLKASLAQEGIDRIAVYYRDLRNGPWLGFNEDEGFDPASLTKVPLMITWLKKDEMYPGTLQSKIRIESVRNEFLLYPPEERVSPGMAYTVQELIGRAIVYSDNDATRALNQSIDAMESERVFESLGIEMSHYLTISPYVSAQEYATFFRILYNASFLDRRHSEDALALMTRVKFTDGLVKGVPQGTAVAHKFGEHGVYIKGAPVRQLHDCGIVYHPKHPYVICVMTRGREMSLLAKTIEDISRIVYESIDSE